MYLFLHLQGSSRKVIVVLWGLGDGWETYLCKINYLIYALLTSRALGTSKFTLTVREQRQRLNFVLTGEASQKTKWLKSEFRSLCWIMRTIISGHISRCLGNLEPVNEKLEHHKKEGLHDFKQITGENWPHKAQDIKTWIN